MTQCPPLTSVSKDAVAIKADQVKELLVSTYNRTVGTEVTLRCRLDLVLSGKDTTMCMGDGNWSNKPTCDTPTVTTASPLSNENEPEIMIAMVVVAVVVLLIIAVLCVAIFHSRWRRKREKVSKENDQYNLDSVSSVEDSPYAPRPNVYNFYQNETMRDADQQPQSVVNYYRSTEAERPYRSYNNNPDMYPHDTGDIRKYHVTPRRWAADDNFHHYRPGRFYGYPNYINPYSHPGYLYGAPRRSSSLRNLPEAQKKSWMLDLDDDPAQRAFRRDGYLWRSNHSLGDLRIPRPRY